MPLNSTKDLFKKIQALLSRDAVYVVGGAVRNRLLGCPTSDFDLLLPYDPTLVSQKIAKALGGTAFPLDLERGVTRIAFENAHFDLARQQGKNLETDISNRDFSINTLLVPLEMWLTPDWKRHILDQKGGLLDIKKRQVKAVSTSLFKDDPLRLLRAFRIAAEHSFSITNETLELIKKYKHHLPKAAPERIREEFLKLLSTREAYPCLILMEKSGLLDIVFPDAKKLKRTAPSYYGKGGVLKHTLESVNLFEEIMRTKASWFPRTHKKIGRYLEESLSGHPRSAHLKWALLLHDIGKPDTAKWREGRLRFFEHEHVGADKIPSLAKRFRWSSEETSRYAKLVRNHMRAGNLATHAQVTDKAIHRFFRDLGDEAIAMLLVSLADHLTYLTPQQRKKRNSPHELLTLKMIHRFYHRREKILPPKLLDGHAIMKTFNIPPSPLVGALLTDLKEAQCEQKICSQEEALAYLKGRLKWHQKRETLD